MGKIMNFYSKLWHTHSDGLPGPYKNILVLYHNKALNPALLYYNAENNDFRTTTDASDITSVEDFQRWLGCWIYLDDLLAVEQKLSKAIETLQKIAWSKSTDRYWKADYKTHLYWCKSVADETLKELKGSKKCE